MSTNTSDNIKNLIQEIEDLKTHKAQLSETIANFGEIKKSKMNSVLSVLIKLIAAFSVAFFFIEPVYYIYALATLLGVVAIGVINMLIVNRKNKKQQTKLSELKLQESRVITQITAKNAQLAALRNQE